MTDSPYLPDTRVRYAWDSTTLGYLKRCPRLYQYLTEGWISREESIHLRFGIEYHHSRQAYDISRAYGIHHDDAVFDVVRDLLIRTAGWDPDHKDKTRFTLLRTVIWGLDKGREDPAQTVLREDGSPMVELSFRFELDWGPATGDPVFYVLCGHIDKVVELAGERYVDDYKTTSYKPTQWYFDKYEPDNQMTLYSIAGKVVLGAPVRGVVIDAAQVKEEYTEFGRGITMRTEDQQQEWIQDLHYWFALAEQFAIQEYWPMNDTACDKFGGCQFRGICSKSPSVRQQFLEGNFIQLPEEERWNPLKIR